MSALLWLLVAAALVAGGAAAGCWIRRERTNRELAGLKSRLDEVLVARGVAPVGEVHDAWPALARAVEELVALERRTWEQRAHETVRREQADARWRESEQRYALAVRGANDGMWEWELATGNAHYSPRWKSILGFAEAELGSRPEEWIERIHPADRERVQRELDLHVQGRSERFEIEHRLRHRDGSWRWVLARASAVRHASGKASRLVGLMTDISSRKRVQEALLELADGLASVQGEACFQALVRSFAQVLGVREAFVCECIDHPSARVRMLARWKGNEFARCVEFDLAGTACEEVIGSGAPVFWPQHAGERWPQEREYEREAYLGLPCFDSAGRVIGHIACADPVSMPEELPHQAILKIFAVRAGIELERRQLERERRAVGLRNSLGYWALH
jgi:PAS domain S-box-containing protein